jgi:hypothetical protein
LIDPSWLSPRTCLRSLGTTAHFFASGQEPAFRSGHDRYHELLL